MWPVSFSDKEGLSACWEGAGSSRVEGTGPRPPRLAPRHGQGSGGESPLPGSPAQHVICSHVAGGQPRGV